MIVVRRIPLPCPHPPALLGYLLDHGRPAGVFVFIGVALLLGVGTVMQVRLRSRAPVHASAGTPGAR